VPGLALESFEGVAEAFVRARAWREHQFVTDRRPGRGLISLYETDFPDLTSTDLWADLQAATPDDPRQHTRLSAMLAMANLEGHTRDFAVQVSRIEVGATVTLDESEIPWREAASRWPLVGDVPRRHALEDQWRGVFRSELNPILERWHEALRAAILPLGADDWLTLWPRLLGIDPAGVEQLAQAVLSQTEEVYGNALGVYLGQLELPIDDAWNADADWAFRAPRFDAVFPTRLRMPVVIRTLRELGIELEEQTSVHIEPYAGSDVDSVALEVPADVRVLLRLVGGWLDFARTLRGLGSAEHLAHTDASLRVWERWLGDSTPTIGYGSLLESLVRDRTWLVQHLEYAASDDFRVIAHLEWLRRVRALAAAALYEQRLWRSEPGSASAADFEESLSAATRIRHFGDEYLGGLLGAPWSTFGAAFRLRAEVFAAQLRLFLKREFDEEWWRSNRAAYFIRDELWRPGKRHSGEELLGFMGFEGFDAAVLSAEALEVLQPV
jgi:hypothetical protein